MIAHVFAALLGAVLTATLSWQIDMPTFAFLLPLGASFFVLGAAILVYVVRLREAGSQQKAMRLPPPEVVWC